MKLLFDQNISPRLIAMLEGLFPGSAHVRDVGLASAADDAVWEFAKHGDFVIATKDTDFRQRSFTEGHPPKVLWLRLGNCTTEQVADLLSACAAQVRLFVDDAEASYLALG